MAGWPITRGARVGAGTGDVEADRVGLAEQDLVDGVVPDGADEGLVVGG